MLQILKTYLIYLYVCQNISSWMFESTSVISANAINEPHWTLIYLNRKCIFRVSKCVIVKDHKFSSSDAFSKNSVLEYKP